MTKSCCSKFNHYILIINSIMWTCIRSYDYIGCFREDYPTRILTHHTVTTFNVAFCITSCMENKWTYAGLRGQTDKHCYCNSVLPAGLDARKLPLTDCDQCQGYTNTYCGGELKISLYRVDWNVTTPEATTSDQSVTSAFLSENTTSFSTTNVSIETDTVIEPTPFTITTSQSGSTNIGNNETCPCTCVDVTSVGFQSKLKRLVQNITIDRKLTSLYIRSKISVYEPRTSSVTIGVVGIVTISAIIILIIAADIHRCWYNRKKHKN